MPDSSSFLPKLQLTKHLLFVTKLPPRPADYDYYWYEDDDGNWRNEYDDMGYEFDPERWDLFFKSFAHCNTHDLKLMANAVEWAKILFTLWWSAKEHLSQKTAITCWTCCLPPEGQEVVNLVVVVLLVVGIISFFFHWPCLQTSYKVLLEYWGDFL